MLNEKNISTYFIFLLPFNSSVVFILAQACQCLLGSRAYISNTHRRGTPALHSGEIPQFSNVSPARCLCIWSCPRDGQIDVVITGTSSLFHAPSVSHEWDWSGIRNEMLVNSALSHSPMASKATPRQILRRGRPYPWFFCIKNPSNDVLFDFLKRRTIFTKCHWHAGSKNGFANKNLPAHFAFYNCHLAA